MPRLDDGFQRCDAAVRALPFAPAVRVLPFAFGVLGGGGVWFWGEVLPGGSRLAGLCVQPPAGLSKQRCDHCCLVLLAWFCCSVPSLRVWRHRCAQFPTRSGRSISGSGDLVVRGPLLCLLQDNLQRAAMAAAASAVDEAMAEVKRLAARVRKAEDQADKAEQERLPEHEQAEAKAAQAKAKAALAKAKAALANAEVAHAKLAHASADELADLEVRKSTTQVAWRTAVDAWRTAVDVHSRQGDIYVCVCLCVSIAFFVRGVKPKLSTRAVRSRALPCGRRTVSAGTPVALLLAPGVEAELSHPSVCAASCLTPTFLLCALMWRYGNMLLPVGGGGGGGGT